MLTIPVNLPDYTMYTLLIQPKFPEFPKSRQLSLSFWDVSDRVFVHIYVLWILFECRCRQIYAGSPQTDLAALVLSQVNEKISEILTIPVTVVHKLRWIPESVPDYDVFQRSVHCTITRNHPTQL